MIFGIINFKKGKCLIIVVIILIVIEIRVVLKRIILL